MALPPIPKPQFPSVPNVPGVPQLVRSAAGVRVPSVGTTIANIAIGRLFNLLVTEQKWGVYSAEGKLLIHPDTFMAFEYARDNKVSDYPTQNGGFGSYNKVAIPDQISVTMVKSGKLSVIKELVNVVQGGTPGRADDKERGEFLTEIDNLCKSLDLCHVVTPEAVYVDMTGTKYNYRREASNSAYMITANVDFQKVRLIEPVYTKSEKAPTIEAPKAAGAAANQSTGKVQPEQVKSTSMLAKKVGQAVSFARGFLGN